MVPINIKSIARLSRLHLSEAELKILEPQVGDILKYVEELKIVPVDGVEPTSHPLSLSDVFRQDSVQPSLPIAEFLKHSPKSRGNFFEVPKIIEDKPR